METHGRETRSSPIEWTAFERLHAATAEEGAARDATWEAQARAEGDSVGAPTPPRATVVRMPLTAAMRSALARQRIRLATWIGVAVGVPAVAAIGAGLYYAHLDMVGYILAMLALIAAGAFLFSDRELRADRAAGEFRRVSGIMHGEEESGEPTCYYVVVAGLERYPTASRAAVKQLAEPTERSADMSVSARILFEVRDAEGTVVYRDPTYRPKDETA